MNFSRFSLAQPSFVEQLVKLCDKYGISPGLLEIEITESIRNAPEIDLKELIGKLRQAGFTVALDDFGTEYVNLSLLSSVEFDVLKLDKTMVDDMVNNPKAQAIIESIAGICKKSGNPGGGRGNRDRGADVRASYLRGGDSPGIPVQQAHTCGGV